MDAVSVLTLLYVSCFVVYMNIANSADKITPITTLSTLTLATVSYHGDNTFKSIIQASMTTIFVSLFLVSLISRTLSHGTSFRKLVSCFSWIPSEGLFRISLFLFTLVFSGFINNSMIVAITIPLVQKICRKKNWNASSYLLPISFASMMGGTTTLIGSSTNLIAYELLQSTLKLNMFSMFLYSFLTGLVGIVYLSRVSSTCLTNRDPIHLETRMFRLPENSGYHQQMLRTTPLQNMENQLCAIIRDTQFITMPVQSDQVLLQNDVLVYVSTGLPSKTPHLEQETQNIQLIGNDTWDEEQQPFPIYIYRGRCSAEVDGKVCTHIRFKKKYGLVVLAIIRNDSVIRNYLSNVVFATGDEIIVASNREHFSIEHPLFDKIEKLQYGKTTDGYVSSTYSERMRELIAWLVVVLFVTNGIGGTFSYAWASLVLILGWYALEVMASWICIRGIGISKTDIREVWNSQISVFIIIYASLLFTQSIAKTEIFGSLSSHIGNQFQYVSSNMGRFGYFWGDKSVFLFLICVVLHLLVSSISLIFSNAATVTLFLNILLEIHKKMALHSILLKSLAFVIIHGGSSCFASPIGYHTNVMVSQYSNYHCRDFITLGLPLHLIHSFLFSFLVIVL